MASHAASASRTVISGRMSRGWRIGFGLLTVIAGVLILVWPGAAAVTVAIILGAHLVVAGIYRVVTALVRNIGSWVTRTGYLLLGVLLVVAGILCFSAPFHAIAALMVLVGLAWIVSGVAELIHGFGGGGAWTIVSGAVSVLAGIVVVAYPAPSALTAAWLFGFALVAIGATVTIGALARRT